MGMDDDHRMDVENALLGPYQEKSKTFSSLKNKPFWVYASQIPPCIANSTLNLSPEAFIATYYMHSNVVRALICNALVLACVVDTTLSSPHARVIEVYWGILC